MSFPLAATVIGRTDYCEEPPEVRAIASVGGTKRFDVEHVLARVKSFHDDILLIDSLCTTRAFESNILLAYCNAAGELSTERTPSVRSLRRQRRSAPGGERRGRTAGSRSALPAA